VYTIILSLWKTRSDHRRERPSRANNLDLLGRDRRAGAFQYVDKLSVAGETSHSRPSSGNEGVHHWHARRNRRQALRDTYRQGGPECR